MRSYQSLKTPRHPPASSFDDLASRSDTLPRFHHEQLRRVEEPFAANLAFSPDPEQQFLYVGGGKAITIVDRKTFGVLGRVQVEKQLGGGHHIAADSKGNLSALC